MKWGLWEKIKVCLGLKRDADVLRIIDEMNMQVMVIGGVIMAIVEFSMAIMAQMYVSRHVHSISREVWMDTHLPAYLMLCITSVIVVIFCAYSLKTKFYHHMATVCIEVCYIVAGVSFGAYISYMDYISNDKMFTFFTMYFIVAALLVLNPLFSITVFPISFAVYYVILNNVRSWSNGTTINYIQLLVTLIIVSIFRYNLARYNANYRLTIEHVLCFDVLTGAMNLHSLKENRRKYVGKKIYILMADIDDFKYFNDRFGHAAGDDVVKKVIEFAEMETPFPKDVYRLNGDGTGVIMYDTNTDDVLDYAKRWMEMVRGIEKNGYEMYINLSIGIIYGVPGNVDEVIRMEHCADREMYAARKQGGNRIEIEDIEKISPENLDDIINNTSMDDNNLDTLTGLPNLALFRARAQKVMINMQNNNVDYGYIFFDIKNFRSYNEQYGFENGDLLLKQLATILQTTFRGCLITRVGEDHFILITEMDKVVDKIEGVHRTLHTLQQDVHLELKAGIYEPGKDDYNVSQACDRAKIVCDSIKNDFNSIYKYYDDDIMREMEKFQYIVDHIDEAIENDYIEIYYQPIIRTVSGELCGAEALARWNDPKYGFLQPGDFIDVLERNRQIHKLDMYVVRKVCKDYQMIRGEGYQPIPVSFNMSRLDFECTNVVKTIEDITNEFMVPHDMIHIEITESALIDNLDYMKQEVNRLRSKGYQVWMDDFGTGYSALNILQDYEFDLVKMDMVFLKNYNTNPKSKDILSTIVDMCKRMHIQTLAEGVETLDQLSFLRSIGCEKVQGFYFNRPQPLSEVMHLLELDKFVIENRARRDYYDTIGRVNVLSQAPMDYFEEVMERATRDSSQIFFSGFPLAIAECVGNNHFQYILANDKYHDLLQLLHRGSLSESSDLINSLNESYKNKFREGLRRSKRNGTMEVVEYEIDGRKYVTHMRYITSMRDRDAVLLALENTSYDNLTVV